MIEVIPKMPKIQPLPDRVIIEGESGEKAGVSSERLETTEYVRTNRCKGLTPTTSGWTTAPASLSNITDGDYTTVSGTGVEDSVTESYVQIDLEKVYTGHLKTKIGYWVEDTTPAIMYHQFKIRVSTDGVTWQIIKSIYTYDTTERTWTFEFPFISARYIRLQSYQAYSAGTDAYLKIYEVEFFATSGQPSDPPYVLIQGDYAASWGRLEPWLSAGVTYNICLTLFTGGKSIVSVWALANNQETTFIVEGSHDGTNWAEFDRFTLLTLEKVVFTYITAAPLIRVRSVETDSQIFLWICAK